MVAILVEAPLRLKRMAQRATAADLAELRQGLSAQAQSMAVRDFQAFFVHDEAMHRKLMDMAGRPFVWTAIAGAKAQLDRVRFLSLEDEAWPEMIMTQHRAFVACVAARDPKGAVQVMTAHLRTAFAAVDRIAASHAEFFEGIAIHLAEPE